MTSGRLFLVIGLLVGLGLVEDPREPAWRPLGMYQGFGAHLVAEVAPERREMIYLETNGLFLKLARRPKYVTSATDMPLA